MSKKAAPKTKPKQAPKAAPKPAPKSEPRAASGAAPAAGSRRKILIAGGVVLVCLAFAVPKLIGALHDPDAAPAVPAVPVPVQPAPAPGPAPKPHAESGKGKAAPAPAKTPVETSKDGDLAVAVKLRWQEYEAGDRILASVKYSNHTLKAVHVPAAGEPNPGLAIVVEDASGNEVRRVVESGKSDQLPRRLVKIESGYESEVRAVVLAEDETPLPPGTYSLYVELRPDPLLARLGLPVWTAPKGSVRSEPVPLTITAKAQ